MNEAGEGNEPSSTAALGAQERAVGIATLVAPKVPGFKCTIKCRYTDFLVNEILPDGTVLHLSDLSPGLREKGKKADVLEHSDTLPNGHQSESADLGTATKRKDLDSDEVMTDETVPRKKQRVEEAGDEASAALPSESKEDGTSTPKDDSENTTPKLPEEDHKALQEIFGDTITREIVRLYANVLKHPHRKPRDHAMIKSEPLSEKSKRTEAHVAIRRIFASKLETSTMPDTPGVISIKAAPVKGPSGARANQNADSTSGAFQKGRLGWNELGGEYLHFSLYKENKDTMEVLYYIASRLKVPVKNFQFAGTKDRRAVTVQRVAIFRVHTNRIAELNKNAKGWRAGDFEYKKHGLELGELGGNEFLLTLRDCSFEGEGSLVQVQRLILARKVMENATRSFKERGFLNYYGLQRFGSFTTGTHITGRKILSGNLEGAINTLLEYPDGIVLDEAENQNNRKKIPQDDIDRAQAIKLWRGGKVNEASQKMPRRFQAENALIQYLSKKDRKTGRLVQDRDWQGALTSIPRNLRLMYVHAYQSFVWNTVAGKRWELYGSKVAQGDLVIVGEKEGNSDDAKDEVDEDGEPVFHPAEEDSAPTTDDMFTRARPLSKEEAESGTFDIFDVVLPLPGYDVLYPANAVGGFYESFMASEAGGGIDPHNMRRSWKDISLSGAYRKLMARPGKDVEFEIRSYAADEEQMVETDLETLQKQKRDALDGDEPRAKESQGKADGSRNSAANKVAIVLKLQLGSSQYATMALRELTKGQALNYKPDYSSR